MLSQVILILVLCTLLVAAQPGLGPKHNKTVVCYISSWAVYRPGRGSYSIDNFDPSLCTIAIYAFAGLDAPNDSLKPLDPWQDLEDDGGKAGYKRLTGYKKNYPHLKVLLAIGGWNEGSEKYSQLASHPDRRGRFVKNALEFIRKYNFDGLDLDWEYPSNRGGNHQDKETFVLLVKELSEEFKKFGLHLSSAFGAAKKIIDSAYDVKRLVPYLDTFHIMCYDYFGAWDQKVGLNAPLGIDDELSVDFSIEYFLKLGAPANKLIMGVPFYGRTFITAHEGNVGDAAVDTQGFQGPFTRENGFLGYNEICSYLSNSTMNWKSEWHVQSSEAIAKEMNDKGQTKVVSYDSSRSIANKVRYAMRKNLGGVMVWSIDTDDFRGDCNKEEDTFADFREKPGVKLTFPTRVAKNYPLLRTLNEAIEVSLSEKYQEELIERDRENEIKPIQSSTDYPSKTGPASGVSQIVHSIGLTMLTVVLLKFL